MRQKYHQGKYTIKNPQKYSGKGEPTFRSSWEFTFMKFYKNKFIDSHEIKLVASPQDYHQQKSLKLKLPQDQLRIDQNL